MLNYGFNRTNELIRGTLRDANFARIESENAAVDSAIQFFDRQTDHASVKAKLQSRFAVGIQKVGTTSTVDGTTGDNETGYETYVKGNVGEAIDQGLYEVVTSGVGNKVITALANLFNQPTQSWTFLSGDTAAEDAAELINRHRLAGGFDTTMVNSDSLSCAVNTSFVLVDWIGGHLKYRLVSPTAVNAIFHETIEDNGVERGVDYSELEDATAIVIRLADSIDVDPGKSQYLAIFGRSEVYPFGRWVTYRASRWDNIPEPDEDGVDYRLPSGELANPLSWLAAQNPDMGVPEYPLIRLDGGLSRVTNAFAETTLSLFQNMLEIDLAYSRILKDALIAARGTVIIKNPSGDPLPRTAEGPIALSGDQDMTFDGQSAGEAVSALDVLQGLVVAVGGGYSVPDYQLVPDAQTLTASSGVALLIRTKPLIGFRDYRIQVNTLQVERLWAIEKGMIEVFTDDQSLRDIEQVWDSGELEIPEDLTERTERLQKQQAAGYKSYLMALQEDNGLATIDEAKALAEQIAEQNEEVPPPQQQQQRQRGAPQQFGLTRQQNQI